MALKTATNIRDGQGIITVFHFDDIDDADTFAGPTAPKAYWINNKTDGTVISAVESSGTWTFTVAGSGSNKSADLFVLL